MNKRFNVVVCGSARVGKSTLVNALCGKQVAQTSPSLTSQTEKIEKYILNRTSDCSNNQQLIITIWDTPGIESWTKEHVQKYFHQIMSESQPLCMIFCASPGSFARLDLLEWLIDTSIRSNIFCVLVCTNKFSGGREKRLHMLNDFHSIISKYRSMTKEENNIQFYGTIALIASVNSIVYEDQDLGIRKDVEGINDLLLAITTSLKDEKLVAWCYTLQDNDSFWTNMGQKILEYLDIAKPVVQDFLDKHGKDIGEVLFLFIITVLKKR